jgi:hypothetical protein
VRGSEAIAYLVQTRHGGDYRGRLIGCLLDEGRRVTIASFLNNDIYRETISMVRVSGRYVAYVRDDEDHYGDEFVSAASFDVQAARERWRTSISDYSAIDGAGTKARIRAFVLAKDGAFAYLAHFTDYPSGEQTVRLLARDRRGPDRLLDSGDGIDSASVRLRRQTVTWTNAGEQRSARLR